MHTALHLCVNCFDEGATPVDVGREQGNQRDPFRDQIDLCIPCRDALQTGNMTAFHERWEKQKTVTRIERS